MRSILVIRARLFSPLSTLSAIAKGRFLLAVGCVLLLVAAPMVRAQEFRAILSGVVRDSTGAVIPNAKVTAVKKDSGQSYRSQTNARGVYNIPYILPGAYEVSAEAPAFQRAVFPEVQLAVADKRELDFTLKVGLVTQEVTVTASPTVVSTADASGGTVMGLNQVQGLPLNGRQVYMLLQLTPGVMFTQTSFGATGFSGTRGWDVNPKYTMGGGWEGQNQFLLNGSPVITDNADWGGRWLLAPNVDAIQEFKVMINTYDAEYGRSAGGIVNTTLKSGANAIHGTAFDYLRNSALDANTFTNNLRSAPKGLHIVNQFGGTIGGPIKKNKAFFLGSFEGWREVVPFPRISSTPPASVRPRPDGSVDFSQTGFNIYDPLNPTCVKPTATGCDEWERKQFFGNIIPADRVNPSGRAILNLYPLPNSSGITGNFFATDNLGRYRYNQPMVRVDYNFSEATRMYGTFAWQRGFEHRNHSGFPPPAAVGELDSERDTTTAIWDVTHIFSPTLLLDVQMSYGRFHDYFPRGFDFAKDLTPGKLGLTMPKIPTTTLNIAPEVKMADYNEIIGNSFGSSVQNMFDIRPNLTRTVGRHILRFGGEYELIQFARLSVGKPLGEFFFGHNWTQKNPFRRGPKDGYSVASLVLGYPSWGGMDWNETMFEGWHYYAGYIQDDFRVARNLTLNMGLRWDVQTSPSERHDRINAGFCYTCKNPITDQVDYSKFPNLPNPVTGGVLFAGKTGPRAPYDSYLNSWQPRFGFAYAIRPKTVIRGGYGIFFGFATQHDTTFGFSQRTEYINSLDGNVTPTNFFASGTPFPDGALQPTRGSLGLLTNAGDKVTFDLPSRRLPRAQQWSIGIQQELPGKVLVDVGYSGNYTKQMTMGTQWNVISESLRAQCQANPSTCNDRVPNPFFGILPKNSPIGSSSTAAAWQLQRPYPEFTGAWEHTNPGASARWDALLFRVEKKATHGLTLLSSFTYQKQFERNHFLNGNSDTSAFRDPQPIRELAFFDRTLVWAFSGVWQLPFGKGERWAGSASGVLGHLVDGWTLDWILTHGSGLTVGVPDGYFSCSSMAVPQRTYAQWINNDVSCWRDRPEWSKRVQPDRVGYIRSPWKPNLDLALQKIFRLNERYKVQFRGEAFNFTNTAMFPGPDLNYHNRPELTSSGNYIGFGTVPFQQQNFPRNVELSLKFIF